MKYLRFTSSEIEKRFLHSLPAIEKIVSLENLEEILDFFHIFNADTHNFHAFYISRPKGHVPLKIHIPLANKDNELVFPSQSVVLRRNPVSSGEPKAILFSDTDTKFYFKENCSISYESKKYELSTQIMKSFSINNEITFDYSGVECIGIYGIYSNTKSDTVAKFLSNNFFPEFKKTKNGLIYDIFEDTRVGEKIQITPSFDSSRYLPLIYDVSLLLREPLSGTKTRAYTVKEKGLLLNKRTFELSKLEPLVNDMMKLGSIHKKR